MNLDKIKECIDKIRTQTGEQPLYITLKLPPVIVNKEKQYYRVDQVAFFFNSKGDIVKTLMSENEHSTEPLKIENLIHMCDAQDKE